MIDDTPHSPQSRPPKDRLRPRGGDLYVVRWVKSVRGDVTHRYFRRGHDARRFAAGIDKECVIYAITVDAGDWIEVEA